jgi:hypothetical protein
VGEERSAELRKDLHYGEVDFRWSAERLLGHFNITTESVSPETFRIKCDILLSLSVSQCRGLLSLPCIF